MKTLILMRHAETESIFSANTDFERKLTAYGTESVPQTAQAILDKETSVQQIWHSSAVRTTQTAQLVAEKLGLSESRLISSKKFYGGSIADWLNCINSLDDKYDSIMLIGHNPTISQLVGYLSSSGAVGFAPGHAAGISFEVEEWALITGRSGETGWVFDGV